MNLDLDAWDRMDRYTRMYTYVGAYLHRWALMELGLNRAIGQALGLNTLQGVALCANIQFSAKCHILKTVIDLDLSLDKRAEYTKIINKMIKAAVQRNTVAHDSFFPSDDGAAIHFFVVRAKGKLDVPDVVWRRCDFEVKYKRLEWFAEKLKELLSHINTARIVKALEAKPGALGGLLGGSYLPMPGLTPPGRLGLLSPLPLTRHMSDTSTSSGQTTPQTPEKPDESK